MSGFLSFQSIIIYIYTITSLIIKKEYINHRMVRNYFKKERPRWAEQDMTTDAVDKVVAGRLTAYSVAKKYDIPDRL